MLYQYEVCNSKRSVNEWKHYTRSTVYGKTQVVLSRRRWLLGADVFLAGLGYAPNNALRGLTYSFFVIGQIVA